MADTRSSAGVPSGGFDRSSANTGITIAVVTVPQTTPASISTASYASSTGVLVQADPGNSDTVEIGCGAFTLGSGISLAHGERWKFEVRDPAMLYAASASAAQKIRVLVL